MNEEESTEADRADSHVPQESDEAVVLSAPPMEHSNVLKPAINPLANGEIRTLDGEVAGDEFAADAINYQVLLEKIDRLLDKLKLDA